MRSLLRRGTRDAFTGQSAGRFSASVGGISEPRDRCCRAANFWHVPWWPSCVSRAARHASSRSVQAPAPSPPRSSATCSPEIASMPSRSMAASSRCSNNASATIAPFAQHRDQVEVIHAAVEDLIGEGVYGLHRLGFASEQFPGGADTQHLPGLRDRLLKPGGTLTYYEYVFIRQLKTPFVNRRERHGSIAWDGWWATSSATTRCAAKAC